MGQNRLRRGLGFFFVLMFVSSNESTKSAVVWTGTAVADTFVTTGPANDLANNNYGGAGALMISPSGAAKGEFQSFVRFDLSSAVSQFNSTYGVGQWSIASVQLSLGTNFGTAGAQPNNPIFNTIAAGNFTVDWMANDSWSEGTGNPSVPTTDGITYNTLSSYLSVNDASQGTFSWTAPGNVVTAWTLSPTAGLLNDIATGTGVSFRFFAADSSVNYLFNSRSFGTAANRPSLIVTAVPEPATIYLLGCAVLVLYGLRRFRCAV
jgi:hypothetical protein